MAENKHQPWDLAQMQSLPLEAKIQMTKQRIKAWYDAWKRFEIVNEKTGKTRFIASFADKWEQPQGLKAGEYVNAVYDGAVYVAFSGGKDSTVLKHIIDSMYSDVPATFVNTGLEYPEIQKFVKEVKAGKYDCFNSDIEILTPEMRFDEVIKKYGYPVISKEVSQKIYEGRRATRNGKPDNYATRQFNGTFTWKNGKPNLYSVEKWKYLYESDIPISHMCCGIMKKKPSKNYAKRTGRQPFIGTMAAESKLRRSNWLKYGCNAFEKAEPTSQPLSFWTEQDVLEYIVKYDVPYASVYGQVQEVAQLKGQMFLDKFHGKLCTTGVSRTGCMFCMFGCHLDKLGENRDKNRFQVMKETHPKQYAYCMKSVEEGGLGIKEVLEFIGVPYE